MSGATGAVVYYGASASSAATGSAASAVFGTVATAGGVLVAGAAIYLAARQMHNDYQSALCDYQSRQTRELANWNERNAGFIAAQNAARQMSLDLAPTAAHDPNAAFMLGALSRMRGRLGETGDDNPDAPAGAAELARRIDELAARVASGQGGDALADYEKLAQSVTAAMAGRVKGGKDVAALQSLVRDELAALESDVNGSILSEARYGKTLGELREKLASARALGEREPKMAWQALQLLQTRARGEIRRASEGAAKQVEHAARVRELVGLTSAHAQSVLRQTVLPAPRAQAEAMLKSLSALVAATPVELTELELLAGQSKELFEQTEKALEDRALAQHLEDQVGQVLAGLGYRVTSAKGAEADDPKMVAVLDNSIGVQLNVGAGGQLSGEMVAFSEDDAEVEIAAQERVCDLMDAIFDGLRRRNLVVREKKRKDFKVNQDRLKVVDVEQVGHNATQNTGEVAAPMAMRVGE